MGSHGANSLGHWSDHGALVVGRLSRLSARKSCR